MNRTALTLVLGGIVLAVVAVLMARQFIDKTELTREEIIPGLPGSPLDATYRIDGREITLRNGRAETDEPHVYLLQDDPVFGDLNGDGLEDAALLLRKEVVGSPDSSPLYVTVAIQTNDGYLGSTAVELDDSITNAQQSISYEVLYTEMLRQEQMQDDVAQVPSERIVRYFTLVGGYLSESVVPNGAYVLTGNYTYSDDEQTFTTCDGDVYWIADGSPARAALMAIYEQRTVLEDANAVLATVIGTSVAVPDEGSGTEYEQALSIVRILSSPNDTDCIVGDGEGEQLEQMHNTL